MLAVRRQKHKIKHERSRNYDFECDWLIQTTTFECPSLIELFDTKLSDNNLASK